MKKIKTLFTNLCLAILFLTTAHTSWAATSPLAIGIVNPVQFPPDDFNITGARISLLWGQHRDVSGLDFGLIGNTTTQKFTGLAVSGVFNHTENQATILGLQFAGLGNYNEQKTNVYGLQVALGANYNKAESQVVGFQLAAANLSENTTVYGAQLGIYNSAREVYGLQIGVINSATNLHGLQIGLLNFHQQGLFVVSPILNAGF